MTTDDKMFVLRRRPTCPFCGAHREVHSVLNELERAYAEPYQRNLRTIEAVSHWFGYWRDHLPPQAVLALDQIIIPTPPGGP